MATQTEARTEVDAALDHARAAAQDLHAALTDAVAKQGGAIKTTMGEAVTYLEATATRIAEALQASGHAAEVAIQQAVVDARASVQSISEAVAALRSGKAK